MNAPTISEAAIRGVRMTSPSKALPELRDGRTADGRLTITVEQAGKLLGISRASAYQAAARGDLPVVRLGHRLLVSVAGLERLLAGSEV